jgi:hypothetical protein
MTSGGADVGRAQLSFLSRILSGLVGAHLVMDGR